MGMQALSYLAMELGSYHITQKMTEHGMNKTVIKYGKNLKVMIFRLVTELK